MKRIIILGTASLLLLGCASSNQTSPTLQKVNVDLSNLEGAKYIKGSDKIWQDSNDNISKKVYSETAIAYCKNLNLLGMQGWHLPSTDDVKHILHKKNIFDYDLTYENGNYVYHTSDIFFLDILKTGTTKRRYYYRRLDKIAKRYEYKGTQSLFRCVLDANAYIKYKTSQLNLGLIEREKRTYQGHLKAFSLTKNMKDIKQAYALASTLEEKLQAEKLMVKILPKKIFRLYNGKEGTSVAKSSGLDIGFSGSAIAEKDFSKTFTLKSDYLQYGSYNVKVKFNFDITYNEQRMISFYTSKEHKEKIVTFNLNSKNNYSQTKTVTFNDVTVGMAMSTMGIKAINKTMKDNKLSFEIMGID